MRNEEITSVLLPISCLSAGVETTLMLGVQHRGCVRTVLRCQRVPFVACLGELISCRPTFRHARVSWRS